jgi:hypothetical protein
MVALGGELESRGEPKIAIMNTRHVLVVSDSCYAGGLNAWRYA